MTMSLNPFHYLSYIKTVELPVSPPITWCVTQQSIHNLTAEAHECIRCAQYDDAMVLLRLAGRLLDPDEEDLWDVFESMDSDLQETVFELMQDNGRKHYARMGKEI